MKPVTLKVGERDERGRRFEGWRVRYSWRGDYPTWSFAPSHEELAKLLAWARAEKHALNVHVKRLFRKENRYRKALRELVSACEFVGAMAVAGDTVELPGLALVSARKLLEES